MILCEWDAPEGDPGQSCVHLYARILSSSLTSVSIFSVSCYSIVSISMVQAELSTSLRFLRTTLSQRVLRLSVAFSEQTEILLGFGELLAMIS